MDGLSFLSHRNFYLLSILGLKQKNSKHGPTTSWIIEVQTQVLKDSLNVCTTHLCPLNWSEVKLSQMPSSYPHNRRAFTENMIRLFFSFSNGVDSQLAEASSILAPFRPKSSFVLVEEHYGINSLAHLSPLDLFKPLFLSVLYRIFTFSVIYAQARPENGSGVMKGFVGYHRLARPPFLSYPMFS